MPKPWLPTRRQRLALSEPYHLGVMKSPKHRSTNMVGPFTWKDEGHKEAGRQEIQMHTSLSVELDTPPVWCLSVRFYHNPRKHIFRPETWPDWMRDLALEASGRLIPRMQQRKFYAPTIPAGRGEWVLRSPLLPVELPYLVKTEYYYEFGQKRAAG